MKIKLNDIVVLSGKEKRIDETKVRKTLMASGRLFTDFSNLYLLDKEKRVVENIGVAGTKAVSKVRAELLDEDVVTLLDIKKLENALKDIVAVPQIWLDSQIFKNTNFVNLKNGVLDLSNLSFKNDNCEGMIFDSQLDFSYVDKIAGLKDEAPYFAKFCEQSLGVEFGEDGSVKKNEEKVVSLLQGIGYLMSNVGNLRKAVFFLGPHASGKSTLLHLIARVITPVSNVTAYNFRQLAKSFTMTTVATSKLNIVEEVDGVSKVQMEAFKLLVAGGRISGERKYQTDVELKADVKLGIASNSLPLFEVGNLAPIVDRVHLIIFENTISRENRDVDLEDRLWQERDIIFSMALVAFSKVVQNNGIFKMEAIAETLLNRLLEESNSEELFVKGYLKSCPGNNLAASRVFDAYKAFCRENGFSAKSSHCLYQAILLAYGSAGEKKKVRDPYVLANSSVQGFCGLALEGGETDGN